ncbi:MAG: DNA polymerase III subunit tau [bacterium ADurb.Bin374]|nr:MAG: DNA polymerase III subunit tau [bacterium ADurb.Bin374]
MLSGAAFNAFLKTLEEPPPRVVFVLATTDPQKVPATILSRCQCFDFHAISRKVIVERLTEVAAREREVDPQHFPEIGQEALFLIAECAAGGFRDALSLLDQITGSMSGGIVTLDMVLEMTRRLGHPVLNQLAQCIFSKDPGKLLGKLHELFFRGHETLTVGRDLLEYLRRCLVLKVDPKAGPVLEIPAEQAQDISAQVAGVGAELLMAMAARLERVVWGLRNSAYPRLLLEIELVRLCMGEVSAGIEGLERRVAAVESRIMGGSLPPGVGPIAGPATRVGAGPVPTGLRAIPGGVGKTVNQPIPLQTVRRTAGSPQGRIETTDDEHDSMLPVESGGSPADQFSILQARFMKTSKVNGSFLQQATFESFKNGVVTVISNSGFHIERLRDPKVQAQLDPLLAAVYGPGTRLVVKNPQEALARPKPEEREALPKPAGANLAQKIARVDQEARDRVLAKPAVADALATFGGDVVSVERGPGKNESGEGDAN